MKKNNRANQAYLLVYEFILTSGRDGRTRAEIDAYYTNTIVPKLNAMFKGTRDKSHASTHIPMTLNVKPIAIDENGRWYDRDLYTAKMKELTSYTADMLLDELENLQERGM